MDRQAAMRTKSMTERARSKPDAGAGNGVDEEDPRNAASPLHPAQSESMRKATESLDGMSRYGSLGIQFTGSILGMGALGYWADHAFDTLPWFLITGILLGSVGGFISLVKKVPAPRGTKKKGSPKSS